MSATARPEGTTRDPLTPRPLRVVAVRRESPDTATLTLDAGPGGFAFLPGQFNMLSVFGVGEIPISIAGDPARMARLVHTVRAVGAVSRELAGLRRGATIGVRGPYGRGWPLAAARGRDLLLIAGGVGLAPLRAVVLSALRARRAFGRVTLVCGARTSADLLYAADLARWQGRIEVIVTVDHDAPGWTGHVGTVLTPMAELPLEPARTVAFVCGPEVMMRAAARELVGRGVPPDRIHLSLERSMKCGVGSCGHCQLVPFFLCKDGPVLALEAVGPFLHHREL